VVVVDGSRVEERGGYEAETTNNRMELTAAIRALSLLSPGQTALLHTDSSYVINGITKWVHGWQKNGWLTKDKKEVLNRDLWQALVAAAGKHTVTWIHVRGHSGVELNERVDMIANGFARRETVELFVGSPAQYQTLLARLPKARVVSKTKTKTKTKTGPAYSYVSVLNGVVMTHKTWAECEKRVKGKPARYKKVFTPSEESALVAEWRTL
jgi:ribonuclease HI